jgi:hypothetical protein
MFPNKSRVHFDNEIPFGGLLSEEVKEVKSVALFSVFKVLVAFCESPVGP